MNNNANFRKVYKEWLVVLFGISLIILAAWFYLFYNYHGMTGIDDMVGMNGHSQINHWGLMDVYLSFVMWSVMMVAMMLPSALPMILMFTSANNRGAEVSNSIIRTGFFVAGYLIIWIAYSGLATCIQWGLQTLGLLLPTLLINNSLLSGGILIAAGIFQWTPLRDACITKCRSPLGFIMSEWRDGKVGALVMGIKHGAYCVGCCWLLMSLSLVLGAMNLLWMATLTAFIILEKSETAGPKVSRGAGLIFIIWGLTLIITIFSK